MPPKTSKLAEEILEAFKDQRIIDSLASALSSKLLAGIDQKLTSLNDAVVTVSAKVKDLERDVLNSKQETRKITDEIKGIKMKLGVYEQQSRLNYIVVNGLAESGFSEVATAGQPPSSVHGIKHSTVLKSFSEFCKSSLSMDIMDNDIDVAYRLNKGPKDQYRPLVIRFSSRRMRDKVYTSRLLLRQRNEKIFINEYLTKENAILSGLARQAVRQKSIHSSWSFEGVVYFKQEVASKPTKLLNADQLPSRSPLSQDN